MAAFISASPEANLDDLGDVEGFATAEAGVAFSFIRDSAGGMFRPIPSSESGASVDPSGGLELNLEGELKIKPDTASGDSGVGLSSDGLEIVSRVKTAGDTMTGQLIIDRTGDDTDSVALEVKKNSTTPSSANYVATFTSFGDDALNRGLLLQGGDNDDGFVILKGQTRDTTTSGTLFLTNPSLQPILTLENDSSNQTASTRIDLFYDTTNNRRVVDFQNAGAIGLLDPIASDNAATKNYVDEKFVEIAGDTLNGSLLFNVNGVWVGHATDPNDSRFGQASGGGFLILTGGISNSTPRLDVEGPGKITTTSSTAALELTTGGTIALNCNSAKISNVATPTDNADATNKTYVDTRQATTFWLFDEFEPQGVSPGTTVDGYTTRNLNATRYTGGPAVTRAGDTVTINTSGVYRFRGGGQGCEIDDFSVSLYISPGTSEGNLLSKGHSTSSRTSGGGQSCVPSLFAGIFNVLAPLILKVVMTSTSASYSADALGVPSSIGIGTFSFLEIERLS